VIVEGRSLAGEGKSVKGGASNRRRPPEVDGGGRGGAPFPRSRTRPPDTFHFPEMTMIETGAVAPDFTLRGHDDRTYRLSDFRGRKVALLFYPHDFSEFCTQQHACVRDDFDAFRATGAQLFGISIDPMADHRRFAEELALPYPLLDDSEPVGAVSAQYGVFLAEPVVNRRVTVVVGEDGRVAAVLAYDFTMVPPNAELLDALAPA
jgi:peroxiredoxin